jgi:hypothetical protein
MTAAKCVPAASLVVQRGSLVCALRLVFEGLVWDDAQGDPEIVVQAMTDTGEEGVHGTPRLKRTEVRQYLIGDNRANGYQVRQSRRHRCGMRHGIIDRELGTLERVA